MLKHDPRIYSEKEQAFNFAPYVANEYLLDKLRILNYEKEFLKEVKLKPIHKYYFVVTKNSGEQFYLFTTMAAWLLRKCGKEIAMPQEYDDPNETIDRILSECKNMGMTGDFPPNKLKQGVGEDVVNLLDFLADFVLKKINFRFERPIPPEDPPDEVEEMQDDSELLLDKVEEEMMAAYSDSDDEMMFDLMPQKQEVLQDLKTAVDDETWRLELEHVAPMLKITIRNENRDWRAHLDQMKGLKESIDGTLAPAKAGLEKIYKEIGGALEKIGNREKYLNRELDGVLDNYRTVKDQLSKIRDKYKSISTGVAERNRELSTLNSKVEGIKHQMEERGSSMTDGTPLVNIKKSVAKVKQELMDMDVRIGVLECLLLQTKIKEENEMEIVMEPSVVVY